ncbi:MAG: phospho-N-acetylmuramoyl-pentapeptide-transferase [Clostridia bacterium]|nr:phospho-N-acetylmuramoyl-pentapeptide-transferase [Clostridia bacterium]
MKYVAAAVFTAFICGIILGRILLPVLHKMKFGQNIYELAPEAHKKKQGTPTMGGLVIASAALLAVCIMAFFVPGPKQLLIAVLLLGHVNMGIGFADDMTKIRHKENKGLTPRQKLIIQTVAAIIFAVYCYMSPLVGSVIRIPFLRTEVDLGILYIPITAFIIVGTTNSANLLDGLDGLLTSVAYVDFAFFAILAVLAGDLALGAGCGALVGACFAFLFYNAYPAKMFMGDTGSMYIGGAVSAAAVVMRQPLILLLVAFWMMMSSLSDLIQFAYFRATHGKRIFKMAPIHHHFELSGISEPKIVMIYNVTTILLCLAALLGVC